MRNFFRLTVYSLLTVLTVAALPVRGGDLRIGDSSGGSALNPLRQALLKLAGDAGEQNSEFSINRLTPQKALEKLAAGELELIIMEHRDIPADRKNLSRTPFAAEALVCYSGRGNPLQSLSIRQLKEIWSGDRPVWRPYNGEFNDIHRIGLDFHRGGFVEARFLGGKLRTAGVFRVKDIRRAWLFCSSSALLCAPWTDELPADLKTIAVDGIKPAPETITRGNYPLNLRYEFVTLKNHAPAADKFIKLIMSPEYSAMLRESSLLPIPSKGGKL